MDTPETSQERAPRLARMALFLGIVLSLWGGLHLYVYGRLVDAFALGADGRLALRVAFPILAAAYIVARFVERRAPRPLVVGLEAAGAIWMGLFTVTLSCVAAVDLLLTLPAALLDAVGLVSAAASGPVVAFALQASFTVAAALSALGTVSALRGPRVIRFDAPVPGLPAGLDGFRLVQVSDVHVGGLVTQGYLARALATIRSLEPDLLALVGDLCDEPDGGDGAAFAALASAAGRHGVVAVTGNHEFYAGGERVTRALEAAGVPLLRQTHRVIADGLVVAGVDDPEFLGGRGRLPAAIDEALAGRPPELPVVLLCHQPSAVEHAAKSGVALMLSGHTHGGQLPPFHLLTRLLYPHLSGRHEVGRMLLNVSNGAGFWGPPLRVAAPPDVTCITLRVA